MKRTLPPALRELQRVCRIDLEEQGELLRFIDAFEQLREEDLYTQGQSYLGTNEGAKQLWKQHQSAMLKATYIPKNTQELLVLPSQLGVSFFLRSAYDPAYQLCCCIWDHRERYFPQACPGSVKAAKYLAMTLSKLVELVYLRHRSHLSIDEMKESHPALTARSKRTLAEHIALLMEMNFIQGTPPCSSYSLQVDYEFAPLFTALRTLQRQTRAETAPVSAR